MKGYSFLVFSLLLMTLSVTISFSATNEYRIENVKGNVYRFINNRHRSVFIVTDEGIMLTDPADEDSARWLKDELQKRFAVPVKYIIFSHNHSDHIYGAKIFDDPDTVFIAHELAKQDIVSTKADSIVPDITFTRSMVVSLDGNTVELRYHGPNDGRGSISMLFKPEKVLFIADWIVIGRMPWQKLWSYDIQGMINSTREVLDLDFEIFVGAHADMGNKSDVRFYLSYLEDLYTSVIDGILAGKDLNQLKESIKLDKYSQFENYNEWLPLNIEGVYERLMEESGMGWRPDIQN